jgi:hypothetical protein
MSFSFNDGIPAAPNNPSVDQPIMLQNNVSTQGIMTVDHIGFNAANGGQHQWTQFPIAASFPTPPTPTAMNSVAFPAAGIANIAVAQYKFQTSLSTVFLSAVKAFALGTSGGILASQSFNVASIVRNSVGNYTVTLDANTVTGTDYAVFVSNTGNAGNTAIVNSYTILSATQFTLQFVIVNLSFQDPTQFNFTVMQL